MKNIEYIRWNSRIDITKKCLMRVAILTEKAWSFRELVRHLMLFRYQCLICSRRKLKYCKIKTKGGIQHHGLQNVREIHLFLKSPMLRKIARRALQKHRQKVSLLKSKGHEILNLPQNLKVEASQVKNQEKLWKPCMISK